MKRGRTSTAALLVPAIRAHTRPTAPHDLNDEETEVWASVVNALPADWFGAATLPLLVQFCRHVVQSRRVAELIERAAGQRSTKVADYDVLLRMQERESRAIASLAVKMRISQSTAYDASKKRDEPTLTLRRPWEAKTIKG